MQHNLTPTLTRELTQLTLASHKYPPQTEGTIFKYVVFIGITAPPEVQLESILKFWQFSPCRFRGLQLLPLASTGGRETDGFGTGSYPWRAIVLAFYLSQVRVVLAVCSNGNLLQRIRVQGTCRQTFTYEIESYVHTGWESNSLKFPDRRGCGRRNALLVLEKLEKPQLYVSIAEMFVWFLQMKLISLTSQKKTCFTVEIYKNLNWHRNSEYIYTYILGFYFENNGNERNTF